MCTVCLLCCLQAIDLIDEAGSRVRIAAFNARKGASSKEDPKVDEYLQVGLGLCVIGLQSQLCVSAMYTYVGL